MTYLEFVGEDKVRGVAESATAELEKLIKSKVKKGYKEEK